MIARLVLAALLLATTAAGAQIMMRGIGPLGSGVGGGCSNSLNFSAACNSQYIPAVLQ